MTLCVYLLSLQCIAQDIQKESRAKFDVGLEGMAGVSFGNNFYSFNVGGPSLRLRLNQDLSVGVGALPSFYVRNGRTGARLGVSPRVDYKRWVLFAPFLHMDSTDEWVFSVGFGYKFTTH
jgi:hypothetical protein